MKKYQTTSIVTLPEGTVMELTDAQAATRRHALKAIGKGVYRATGAVQFKLGEVIGLDAEPSKTLANELVDEKEAARRAAADEAKRKKVDAAQRERIAAEAGAKAVADLLANLPAELRAQVEKHIATLSGGGK